MDHEEQYDHFPYPEQALDSPVSESLLEQKACLEDVAGLKLNAKSDVMVFGAGSGNNALWLAQQYPEVHVSALDISSVSLAHLEARADFHKIKNLTCFKGSLLDHKGKYDYISAVGVLHHLEDPLEGFKTVHRCLKPEGVAGIMVYGKYGRTGVTQLQEAVRIGTQNLKTLEEKLDWLRPVLLSLAPTTWFARGKNMFNPKNDTELVDIFLNPREKCYSLPDLRAELKESKLEVIEYLPKKDKLNLQPAIWFNDQNVLRVLEALPPEEQEDFCEIWQGTLKKHAFYARRKK